jgi:hypothetical protein
VGGVKKMFTRRREGAKALITSIDRGDLGRSAMIGRLRRALASAHACLDRPSLRAFVPSREPPLFILAAHA